MRTAWKVALLFAMALPLPVSAQHAPRGRAEPTLHLQWFGAHTLGTGPQQGMQVPVHRDRLRWEVVPDPEARQPKDLIRSAHPPPDAGLFQLRIELDDVGVTCEQVMTNELEPASRRQIGHPAIPPGPGWYPVVWASPTQVRACIALGNRAIEIRGRAPQNRLAQLRPMVTSLGEAVARDFGPLAAVADDALVRAVRDGTRQVPGRSHVGPATPEGQDVALARLGFTVRLPRGSTWSLPPPAQQDVDALQGESTNGTIVRMVVGQKDMACEAVVTSHALENVQYGETSRPAFLPPGWFDRVGFYRNAGGIFSLVACLPLNTSGSLSVDIDVTGAPTVQEVRAALEALQHPAVAVWGRRTEPIARPVVQLADAALGPLLQPSPEAHTMPDLSGPWSTTVHWARHTQHADITVTFTQQGDVLTGVYYQPNEGHITGRLVGTEFRGTWSRPPYSGHVEITFDPNGRSFHGTYGETPSIMETWTGRR